MGVDAGGGGAKGRRQVNADLNLVPFIDLLSVCILFLLMTVVWVEISRMGAFSQAGGETIVEHSDRSSIRQEREDRDVDVILDKETVKILKGGRSLGDFTMTEAAFKLEELAQSFETPAEVKVSVRASDDTIYENVVLIMDALFSVELTQVQIAGFN